MNKSIKVNGATLVEERRPELADEPATIPRPPSHPSVRRHWGTAIQRRGAEPYDSLLWRLQARQSTDSAKVATLGLIGCERRVGVTTVASNLAVRASELQLGPVLLVETSICEPRLTNAWGLVPTPGLAQLLAGEASFNECLRPGPAADLTVLPGGTLPRGETSVLEPGVIDVLLAESCADHRLVIFDLPAADQLQQMLLLAKQLDQVLLVVRSDSTRQRHAQRVADRLLDDGVPLAGAVLNRQRSYVPRLFRRWI
jgi:Mrp family chromosome partitioning ATPase